MKIIKNIKAEINQIGKTKIRINQWVLGSGYSWLETILLLDDKEVKKVNDYTLGFFHCKECDTFEGFCFKLPPEYVCYKHPEGCFDEVNCKNDRYKNESPSKEMHNARNAFWRNHHHGDGRILVFERDIE